MIGALLMGGLLTSYSCSGKCKRHQQEADSTQNAQVKMVATAQSTESSATQPRVKFERQGGGNLEYEMTPLTDSILVHVTKQQFREADYTFCIAADSLTKATIAGLIAKEISCGEEETDKAPGTFMCGGTWKFAFLLEGDSTKTPIFDKTILGQIATTEEAVREAMEAMENKKSEE